MDDLAIQGAEPMWF